MAVPLNFGLPLIYLQGQPAGWSPEALQDIACQIPRRPIWKWEREKKKSVQVPVSEIADSYPTVNQSFLFPFLPFGKD